MNVDFSTAAWIHKPAVFSIDRRSVKIVTEPNTDLWQRSYYGFSHDTAHALLLESESNFTFSVKATYKYRERYDQCGPIIYLNSESWFKASVEYETETFSRLGSVVTNRGYSDWATTDIPTTTVMWYRLSRRGPDFLAESSTDGIAYSQMRIFHLFDLGETSAQKDTLDFPAPVERPIRIGLYACSPLNSSFEALFTDSSLVPCSWMAHGTT